MGASITKPSSDGEGGKASAAGNNAPGQQEGGTVALQVKLPPGPLKAVPAQPQTQTEQPDPYQLRDLKAQEDMAYWSMWMLVAALGTFVVTAFGTLLIWRQVRLTRMAVEDTSEATEAMREANAIAAQAQRPWVDIQITPQKLAADGKSWEIWYSIDYSNIGASVAEGVWVRSKVLHLAEDPKPEIHRLRESWWDECNGPSDFALIPGETFNAFGQSKYSESYLPWKDGHSVMFIVATAFYHLPGKKLKKDRRRTDRLFRIGFTNPDDPMSELFIKSGDIRSATGDGVKVTRTGPNITT